MYHALKQVREYRLKQRSGVSTGSLLTVASLTQKLSTRHLLRHVLFLHAVRSSRISSKQHVFC